MSEKGYPNASIAGAGTIGGGIYNEINISGSGSASGDITCAEFDSAGSAKVKGNLTCTGKVDISGAFRVEENLNCASLDAAGAIKIVGGVIAKDIDISGAFVVGGDCEAEEIELRGSVTIDGLLNAESINIRLDSQGTGNSKVGQIGGGSVTIRSKTGSSGKVLFIFPLGRSGGPSLETTLIEADLVDIENVKADTVRAIDAVIGDGCEIGTVEYTGDKITVSENAKIKNIVKI